MSRPLPLDFPDPFMPQTWMPLQASSSVNGSFLSQSNNGMCKGHCSAVVDIALPEGGRRQNRNFMMHLRSSSDRGTSS
jgi:hypothetical protein